MFLKLVIFQELDASGEADFKKSQSLLISRASCRMQMFTTNMNYRSYLIYNFE